MRKGKFIVYAVVVMAAALIGQPYIPGIMHHVSVFGCRAVTLRQPHTVAAENIS